MNMRVKMWMALAIVFVSGAFIGFFGGQVYVQWRVEAMRQRGPEVLQEFMLKRIQQRLQPRQDQMPAIEELIGRVVKELEEHRRRQEAEQWARIKETLSQMQPVLTAEQQAVFDRMSLEDLLPGPPRKSQQ
jgi:neutral trehalase